MSARTIKLRAKVLLVLSACALIFASEAAWTTSRAQTSASEAAPMVASDQQPTSTNPETTGGAIVQRGTGEFVVSPPVAAPPTDLQPDAPRLSITFDRAPVGLVVQSLLSDFAGASVVIDPRVNGEITIRSIGQLTAAELPLFLRTSVEELGLELIEQAPNAYLLRPVHTQAEGASAELYRPGARTQSGLVIYGLRYVAATEMARLLQPFARDGVTVQPERSREMLILSGPPERVQSLVGTIELLDADWLDGMSFGLVPLEYAEPEPLIAELRTLFGGADGPIGSMVEFVPLPSRRTILILAKRAERLDQARAWIRQLDRPISTSGRIRLLQIGNADAETIAETLSHLFVEGEAATVRITADAARNALIIQSDPATFEEIASLVRQLDTPIDQVVIEATIAEVVLNNDFRFGVQWTFDTRDGGRVTLSEAAGGAIAARFPGFSYGYAGNYVQAALNALASRTNVEVISSPVVITLDNQEAMLQIGDEVPIVTQSAASVTTPDATVVSTVQYRETGILLRVTPRIGANDSVTLEVSQEASEVAATTTSGIDSPTIQQRRFQSTVTVANGETVALGGLIRATRTRTRSGVPYVSAIPLLGSAFRNTNDTVRRTELLVFLTPRIVRTPGEAASATEDLAQRLERIRASRFIERYSPPQ
jgi:general secretion pathway protein D